MIGQQKTQVCSTCKTEKLLEDFYRSRAEASGYHHQCKLCHLKSSREAKRRYTRTTRGYILKRKLALENQKKSVLRKLEIVQKEIDSCLMNTN